MGSMLSKKTKCLIIHGFAGGVHQVKTLIQHLIGLGYDVACPTLKGHSGNREDMKKATYLEWIDSAERELIRLKKSGDEIVLIGFSMGGLIAFNLALKHDIKAIVTINTPIFFWSISQVLRNIADDLKNLRLNHLKRYFRAKKSSPFSAMIQFILLLRQTKPALKKIICPLMIIQAEDDDTVRRKSVDYIYKHVSSDRKKIIYFPEGGHLILESPIAEKVAGCVENFLADMEKNIIKVTAAILRQDDKILICKRNDNGSCPSLWEFPGGKQEKGETLAESLIRECREELGVTIEVGNVFAETKYTYEEKEMLFTFFNCRIIGGDLRRTVHQDIRWVRADELSGYAFCPADVEVAEKLRT